RLYHNAPTHCCHLSLHDALPISSRSARESPCWGEASALRVGAGRPQEISGRSSPTSPSPAAFAVSSDCALSVEPSASRSAEASFPDPLPPSSEDSRPFAAVAAPATVSWTLDQTSRAFALVVSAAAWANLPAVSRAWAARRWTCGSSATCRAVRSRDS